MPLKELANLPELEIALGIHGRAVTGDNLTLMHISFERGAIVPEHDHVHEQIVNVIEGQLELTVGGEKHLLESGKVMVVPSNVPHSGIAITDVKVIDVFYPVREDFRGTDFSGYSTTDDT